MFRINDVQRIQPFYLNEPTEAQSKEMENEKNTTTSSNAPIIHAFIELANLYSKEGDYYTTSTYRNVAKAIRNIPFLITKENAKGLSKGKTKVPGIGKSSSDKIYELLSTGKIEKLQEKRALNGYV